MSTEPHDPIINGAVNAILVNDLPGPEHRALTPVPNKAFWRTALQVGPAALLSLVVLLPIVIQEIVDGFGQHLPDGFRTWLLGFAVFLTLLASTVAKVMALPGVLAWTRQYVPFFAPDPK